MTRFEVKWISRNQRARMLPDPDYPNGIALDVTKKGQQGCVCPLDYPAAGIGTYTIKCLVCGMTAACTTAGRADDPVSIKVPCKRTPDA